MCPNSPYLDYFASLLREVAGRYGPSALYIDNFGVSIECRCRFCAEAFREATGKERPAKTNWTDAAWQEFRRWSRERNFVLARQLVEAIRGVRPETVVVFNRGGFRTLTGHGNPEDIHEFAHHIADNVHGESAVRFYGQSFCHINEQCAFGRAIETPMWTWVEYPLLPWSHVSAPPAEVKLKAAKVLANGGRPMVWSVPRSPDCDERGLEGLAEVFGLAARFPECFNQTEHVPFLGVLYSSQTMEEYSAGDGTKFGECQKEFSGVLALARHNHLPADVLLDKHVTREHLSRYRVLILPNAAALSEEQCRQIAAFVQAGGGLIAMFESSLFDERGHQRADFGLAEALGVSFQKDLGSQSQRWSTGYSVLAESVGRSVCSARVNASGRVVAKEGDYSPTTKLAAAFRKNYSAVDGQHPVTASLGPGFRLPAGGRHLGVKAQGNALGLSTLLTRCRYYCDYPGQPTGFPGLVAHEFGQGRVLYVPGQFGLTYAERGFPDYRRLFRDAVEWMTRGELPVRTTLPDTVEVTLTRSKAGDPIVHIVNCSADLSRPVERVIPVAGATLSVRLPDGKPRRVR
ncbi:MAG: hypothetical protein FJ279_36395, partial [Planctomycetes bacterium]|nr:hypothetical protein [Planctomycetota bacterium]